jgi:probable F420-dependent oxidoreductase
MRLGAVFPQLEIGNDPAVIARWARTVEELGYDHVLAYDHVLGADTRNRPGWRGYTNESAFHEVFVLFGYLAAVTSRLGLMTGVLILPQRQTALVAKQAAEVDVLSGGRLRLGVGVGWNPVEYVGLNEDFGTRGARSEEQIEVLRRLWAAPSVDFRGRWHTIEEAGIEPRPARGTIPIWIGGTADAVLTRAGRIADGWLPQRPPDPEAAEDVARVRAAAEEAGRPADAVGIEARLTLGEHPQPRWGAYLDGWRTLGATDLCVNTMGSGFSDVDEHLAALEHVRALTG